MKIEPIAVFRSQFPEKFGIPRQSGVVEQLRGEIHFLEPYRNPDFLDGLEEFSHLWLIWQFSANRPQSAVQAKVRPPRLGGNKSLGVFATRSPYRPNPIGLSCVEIEKVDLDKVVITVRGADLMDGTPIFDIKPYIPYADSRPEARGGFTDESEWHLLEVEIPAELSEKLSEDDSAALAGVLRQDPRPKYQDDPERVYGLSFAGFNVKFRVEGNRLYVLEIL